MRKLLSVLLIFCTFLSGCSVQSDEASEPVTFYYLLEDYQYDSTPESVIGSEERETSGPRGNLSYLLALYLMGPLEDGLQSPLPAGTHILAVEINEAQILLTISDTAHALSDARFSLACACLTLTCLDLTDAETVTITSGSRNATMSRDNLILFDGGPAAVGGKTK